MSDSLSSKDLWSFVGGTVVGAGTYTGAEYAGAGSTISGAVGGAAGGATSSALAGGNVGQGALYGGVGGGVAGYMGAGSTPGSGSNLGGLGPDYTPALAAGGAGALGGLLSVPTPETPPLDMGFDTAAVPAAPIATPAPVTIPVGTSKTIAPEQIQSAELPIAGRKESTPGEIDLLNRLASARAEESSKQAASTAERYPVSGVPTTAQPTPEERFLGIGGVKGKLKPIY